MTKKAKDVGASVKAQLLRIARERGDDYQLLLLRYANERLLYRLAVSPHASRFVLKGAALFTLWTGLPHRATRDIDLHGIGDPSEAHVRKVLLEVISQAVDDDGVVFDAETLTPLQILRSLLASSGVAQLDGNSVDLFACQAARRAALVPPSNPALPRRPNPKKVVPRVGIEPTTRGFSVHCSTD
jgi:hypothetical protein